MDNYCKTCLHDGVDIGFCDKCYYNHILEEKGIPPTKYEAKPKPLTNYDRLIRKTPEEMAQIMVSDCPPDYPKGECREYEKNDGNLDCPKCWLDWLRQEATDG